MTTSRRGLALLVVVGVLGLLAVLGAAFVTMAQLERRASMQRLFATKALLLARSGIEDAMARLDGGQDPDAAGSRYGGEDWDASGTLNGFEGAAEAYRPGSLDLDACPVRQALRPSFFARSGSDLGADLLPAPARVQVEGRPRGYSGALGSDLVGMGNLYAVKVMPQAGIYINGGDPGQPANVDYNFVLRGILGNLAEALDREDGVNDGSPADQAFGPALINSRPPGGWESKAQVRAWAASIGKLSQWEALEPYVCLHAWVDARTLKPDATPVMQDTDLHTWAEIRQGVDASYVPTRGMPGLEPRAPVSLAWARSRRPVLVALMGGLKGLYLDEAWARNAGDSTGVTDAIGRMAPVELLLDWGLPTDPCRKVAASLAGYPGPLDTWEDWNAFCDTLTAELDSDVYPTVPAMRSLLKANFNPNSRLNKFNPNRAMWHLVDKQDLLVYSTEFVLEPVHACEVEGVGRVLGRDGRLLALRTLRCAIAGPKVARLSTQREFVCEDLGSLDRAGDETGVRIPGDAAGQPFLPASQGPEGTATWGQDLPGLDAKGVGIQSYPEPCVDPTGTGAGLTLSPADYDGSLQLATLETAAEDTYGVSLPDDSYPQDMKLLVRWTADLDLAVSDAFALTGDAARRRNQPDAQQASLTSSLLDPAGPNTLHPDGCYSERGRAPGYPDRDNANGMQGLLSLWMKPNCHMGTYLDGDAGLEPGPVLVRGRQAVKWSNFHVVVDEEGDDAGGEEGGDGNSNSPDQFFALLNHPDAGSGLAFFTCHFEIGHADEDGAREHMFHTPPHAARPPHRWRLLTFAWDLQASQGHETGELVLDDGTGPDDLASMDQYSGSGNAAGDASSFTDDDRFGAHLICLGRRGFLKEGGMNAEAGLGADATFDEFAIYDFGPASENVDPVPADLALGRYRAGRYYKESDYAGPAAPADANRAARWFSAPISLAGGRLRTLSWTQVVPRGLRAPLPEDGKAGLDGDPGVDGRIEIACADLAGTGYAQDISGLPMDRTFADGVLSRVNRIPAGAFRLQAVFRPNLADPDNTPILDPLALDDVTILYDPPGGRRVLAWGEGEKR